MENLNEVKLSRVWKHFKDPDTTLVILTGFRGDLKLAKNIERNKAIAATLKNAGFGYFYVDGFWIENQGTENERKVKEDSIFAVNTETTPQETKKLIDLAHELANKYDQDAILVKTPENTKLLFKNGSSEVLKGNIKPGALGDFYTKLKTNKQASTFIFESERDGKGFFAHLIEKLANERKEGKID